MINVTINNKKIEVEEGTTVLGAARKLGIDIPTLCYHEATGPYGACRVCMVELRSGKWAQLQTSCTYPVWEGLEVLTHSERAIKARKFIIELLLARCPDSKEIVELAAKLGVRKSRFRTADKNEKCILCGLCVRTCSELIGSSAISFIKRGAEREVETPFKIESDTCIGCGACAVVCPTGAIKIEDVKDKRKLEKWHTELTLHECRECGERFATLKELEKIKKKLDLPEDMFDYCSACKRRKLRKNLSTYSSCADVL